MLAAYARYIQGYGEGRSDKYILHDNNVANVRNKMHDACH